MNGQERKCLGRLHDCLTRLRSTPPVNPMDIAGHARCSSLVSRVGDDLVFALSAIGQARLEDARLHLDDAERKLDSHDTNPTNKEGE